MTCFNKSDHVETNYTLQYKQQQCGLSVSDVNELDHNNRESELFYI